MPEIKATYGLVGFPLGHSLSPFMHNTAFKALKVDAVYQLFPMTAEVLEPFFESLKEEGNPIFGLNVTVPYKEKVIPFLDALSPYAKKVGAVNTVTISRKRELTGHNTDGPGFLAHLGELGFSARDKGVVILGAGGAARALVSSLCLFDEQPESIRIFDVDIQKAQGLISDLGERLDVSRVNAVDNIEDLNIELADLLVNATPIGLKKEDKSIVPCELLHKNMLVYDLIYNPRETALLRAAKEKGAAAADGLGMLFYQGVLAFEYWAEIQIPQNLKDKMRAALEQGKVL